LGSVVVVWPQEESWQGSGKQVQNLFEEYSASLNPQHDDTASSAAPWATWKRLKRIEQQQQQDREWQQREKLA